MSQASAQGAESEGFVRHVTQAVLSVAGRTPTTLESTAVDPHARARELTRKAARKAGAISGSLALPPGLAGMLTLLPDLVLVWRLQAQLVADIAGAFGQTRSLSREQMLYCLFQHSVEDSLSDIVTRVGQRVVIRKTMARSWRAAASKVAVKVARESVTRTLTRFLPLIGAVGVAVYAYRDTKQVAEAATLLFEHEQVEQAPS